MSTRMGKYGIIFKCQCGEEIGDEYSDFHEAWNEARREGWTYNGENHTCVNCRTNEEDALNDPKW